MDLVEVILLSSNDEIIFYPGQSFSEESDELNRAFFNPEDLLRALDEPLEGIYYYPLRSSQILTWIK